MNWQIVLTSKAQEDLAVLSSEVRDVIVSTIEKKLTLEPEKYGGYLRGKLKRYLKLKVMDYRVVYRIEKQIITVIVIAIGPRRNNEVYIEAEKRV